MTSRERVAVALAHQEPDRVPLDLGASAVTSMHVSSVYLLRQALGLDAPGTPVKVVEPYQMLGEIAPDLVQALGVDVVGLMGPDTRFGFPKSDWKAWTTFDGTPVLVPAGFNTESEANGDLLMYPEGDRTAPPSGRMPAGGWYFDAIIRQPPIVEENLNLEDNCEEFTLITDAEVEYFRAEAERLYTQTEAALLASFGGTAFGDIANVPATGMKYPKGIRDVEEWYVSTTTRLEYVRAVFTRQCEIGIANLERLHRAVGDRVAAVFVTGTDFGTQQGPFISPQAYRELFFPFHKQVNDWIHTHTAWKTFMHSCGSIAALLDDIVAAGFDIINPVQVSAAGMDPEELKRRFGDRLVFWGGGVDTQRVLPFGTPEEVRAQVRSRLRTFGSGGGFIFNTIHNVQAKIPVANLLALYDTVREYSRYPLS